MRKIIKGYISIALCIAILTTSILLPINIFSATATADSRGVVGDVDDDGVVSGLDYALMKQYLSGSITDFPVADDLWAGDVDESGNIDALDLALIKQYLLKAISWFPKEQPTVPSGLAATALTDTGLTLSWTSSSGIDAIDKYEVKRQGDNSTVTLNASGTSYNDTGLKASTSYTYTIVAIDIMGRRSDESSPLNIITKVTMPQVAAPTFSPSAGTYAAPQTVTISCITSGAAIYYTTDGSTPTTSSQVYSGPITVSANTTIKAYAVKTGMPDSEVVSSTYSINTSPSAPINLRCTEKTDSTVVLTWETTSGLSVSGYEVYLSDTLAATVDNTMAVINNLKPNLANVFKVKAKYQDGRVSDYSLPITVVTDKDSTPPSVPAALSAAEKHDTSVTLIWNESTDNTAVAGYEIYRNSKRIATSSKNSYTDNTLSSGTTYNYSVKAYDTAGNISNASEAIDVTTLSNDDNGNDFADANPIDIGIQKTVAINVPGDIDCFYFNTVWNGTYSLESSGSTDTYAELYDSSTNLIASNNDQSLANKNFYIKTNLTQTKKYYIKVKSNNPNETGNCVIIVKLLSKVQTSNSGTTMGQGLDDAYTKLLMHFDGTNGSNTFTDESGKVVTLYGNPQISTAQSEFGGASGYFDGSREDYLSIPYSSDFNITTGDFTIDWWQYEISRNTWSTPFSLSSVGGTPTTDCMYINTGNYDYNARWLIGNGSNSWVVYLAFTLPSLNTWHHYALVRTGSSFMAFVDGQIAGTATYSGNIRTPTTSLILGVIFNGYIDELRISKGIARWTSNFTPPNAPYGLKLSKPRSSQCTITFNDKIYILGGNNTITGGAVKTVEEYNPFTIQMTNTANMLLPSADAGAAELNGKIYIAGGINESDLKNRCLKILQVYDPVTDTWVTKQDMGTPRKSLGQAAVNGNIYAFGGVNNTGILDSAEVYDPSDNTWSDLPNKMPVPRAGFAITVCDNKIYLIGGYNKDGEYLNSVDVYDPEANTWTTLQMTMPTARTGCEAVTLNNKIYVLGGWNGSYLNTVEIYDPATEQWTAGNPFSIARTDFGAAVIGTKIYIVGGNNYYAGGYLDSVEEYDSM